MYCFCWRTYSDRHEVAFKSATEPFDTSTPLGRAMLGILAVFGQLERDTIIERTKFGLQQRARRGLWHGASYPFGYQMNEHGILEVIPDEAALVREVFAKFIAGESRRSIANWLAKRTTSRYVDPTFILKMIQRRTYVGSLVMKGCEFAGRHEPIIDEETFRAAQRELNSRLARKGARGPYLLSGLMTCAVCGGPVHYITTREKKASGKVYTYVRVVCRNKRRGDCKTRSFVHHQIEELVIERIRSLELAEDLWPLPVDSKQNATHLPKLQRELDQLEAQRDRLVDAIQTGALPVGLVKDRLEKLEQSRRAVLVQIEDGTAPASTKRDDTQVEGAFDSVQFLWDDLTFAEQRQIIRLLIETSEFFPTSKSRLNGTFNTPCKVLWFVMNYTYYGMFLWLPSVLSEKGYSLVISLGYARDDLGETRDTSLPRGWWNVGGAKRHWSLP